MIRLLSFIDDLGFDKYVFYRIKMHIKCLFGKHFVELKDEDGVVRCWTCWGKL